MLDRSVFAIYFKASLALEWGLKPVLNWAIEPTLDGKKANNKLALLPCLVGGRCRILRSRDRVGEVLAESQRQFLLYR